MGDAQDEPDTGSVTVRYRMEIPADILESRRLFWPRAHWWDRVAVVAFLGLGVATELLGADPTFWVVFYILAGLAVLREFVLLPRAITKSQRSIDGKINVVRLDEEGLHDDVDGIHSLVEWKMATAVVEDGTTIGIRYDLRGGNAIPKRAFETPEECEAFVAYARAHIVPSPEARQLSHRPAPPDPR